MSVPNNEGGAMSDHATSSTDVRDRAESFRATLGARQEADAILAEAAQVRRQAGVDAERLVAEAETLAAELTQQARSSAEQVTAEARERADGILAQARESADRLRVQARADAEAAREQFLAELEAENRERLHGVRQRAEELLAGIETVVRGLGSTLQQAEGSVSEMERSLHQVRSDAVERLPETPAGPSPRELAAAAETAERAARTEAILDDLAARSSATADEAPAAEPDPVEATPEPGPAPEPTVAVKTLSTEPAPAPTYPSGPESEADQRPLGWLFRTPRT